MHMYSFGLVESQATTGGGGGGGFDGVLTVFAILHYYVALIVVGLSLVVIPSYFVFNSDSHEFHQVIVKFIKIMVMLKNLM